MKKEARKSMKDSTSASEKPLQSWKEIAAYLERDERTARRWEQANGLPVHRHGEGKGSSVYAYATEIDAWRAHGVPGTQARSLLWRWSIPVAMGSLVLVTFGWFVKYGPIFNPPNPLVKAADGIVLREVMRSIGDCGGPSPDGRFLSFVDWKTGEGDIAIEDLISGERRHLTDNAADESEEFALSCAISPDGTQIAYDWYVVDEERCELRLMDIDGSSRRTLLGRETEVCHEGIAAWSSDGKNIATIGFTDAGKQLVWVSAADGSTTILKTLGEKGALSSVCPSSDKRYLAFTARSKKYPPQFDIFLVSLDGSGETTVLVEHPANERVLGWVPGRDDLIFLSDRSGTWDVWVLTVRNGRPVGDPARVYTNLGNVAPIGFTNDGTYYYEVFSRWRNYHVAGLDPQSGKLVGSFTQPLVGSNIGLDWSSDGRYLAYALISDSPGGPGTFEYAIHIRDLQTGEDRTVSRDLRGITVQRWSPDGRALLVGGFKRKENVENRRKRNLYLVDPQSGETKLLVDKPESRIILGEWAPNGKGFYYIGDDSVMLRDLDSGLEKKIYENPDLNGFLALSPKGEKLAIGVEDEDHGSRLSIFDISSGKVEKSIILGKRHIVGEYFDWSPDNRYVYYTKAEGTKATSLWRIDILSETPERLWQTDKRLGGPRIHPGGEKIAFDEVTHETAIWVMENLLPKESTSN